MGLSNFRLKLYFLYNIGKFSILSLMRLSRETMHEFTMLTTSQTTNQDHNIGGNSSTFTISKIFDYMHI